MTGLIAIPLKSLQVRALDVMFVMQ